MYFQIDGLIFSFLCSCLSITLELSKNILKYLVLIGLVLLSFSSNTFLIADTMIAKHINEAPPIP